MDGITTDKLVERMRASKLEVSAESLRQDVQRGLLSPLMPSTETPGRGVLARWSPMSVRRARRMARLRKRGVNGHVLPLLLFLEDGWGWDKILPDLQAAATKAWALDRAYLNHPHRVRSADDLLDKAHDAEAWADDPHHQAITAFRAWLYGQLWSGQTLTGATPVPLMVDVVPAWLGRELSAAQRAARTAEATELVRRREALQVPAADFGVWLATLDPASVERGRELFRQGVRLLRHPSREGDKPGPNPLTLWGESPAAIAAYFRNGPGRLTPAHVLGACIGQAMVMGAVVSGMGTAMNRGT